MLFDLSADRHFIDRHDVLSILKHTSLYPINQRLRDINTETIERKIAGNELIDRVNVYKTPSANIHIEVTQKTPVLRVFSTQGSYYVDERGHTMPVSPRYATYLPIANGIIEKSFATTDLYKFALFLQKHDFWNNQIEQIYVYPKKDASVATCRARERMRARRRTGSRRGSPSRRPTSILTMSSTH